MGTAALSKTSASEKAARSDLVWILALGIAARVLAIALYFRANGIDPLANWGYENVSIAMALFKGHGFSSPFRFASGPTAFMTPGYPFAILGFMRILGTGTAATFGLIAFQSLISLLTVVIVQKVARRYFGIRTGNLAALLCALAVPMLIAPIYIWDTCLSALLLLVAVGFAPDVRTRRDFGLAALGCAIAALINPALLPALIAIFGWAAWRARLIPWLGLGVFLIAFSPWPIRNYVTMHAFIPLRDNFGYELWLGNHDGSNGDSVQVRDPWSNSAEQQLFVRKGELAYMQEKKSLAVSWVATHPITFVEFTARRLVRFWAGSSKSPVPMTIFLSAAAFLGLVLLWRFRQTFVLFGLPLLVYPLPYYITHADMRYQFVLDPLLVILAAFAFESFFAWTARRPAPLPSLTATVG